MFEIDVNDSGTEVFITFKVDEMVINEYTIDQESRNTSIGTKVRWFVYQKTNGEYEKTVQKALGYTTRKEALAHLFKSLSNYGDSLVATLTSFEKAFLAKGSRGLR